MSEQTRNDLREAAAKLRQHARIDLHDDHFDALADRLDVLAATVDLRAAVIDAAIADVDEWRCYGTTNPSAYVIEAVDALRQSNEARR